MTVQTTGLDKGSRSAASSAHPPRRSDQVADRYRKVRAQTERLVAPLEPEDMVIQSMTEASPAKWHLAHTSWFFEAMVLREADPRYQSPDPRYHFIFNSYYNAVGPQHARHCRGKLSRPTVPEAFAFRRHVDDAVLRFLDRADDDELDRFAPVIETGLQHEQQHQELLVTDVKHMLSLNPLNPVYHEHAPAPADDPGALNWIRFEEGLRKVGHAGKGFAYDNETPRHKRLVHAFEIADRPVTNAEFIEFIEDGGYSRPELWLSDAWALLQREGWPRPIYWRRDGERWLEFTLAGERHIDPAAILTHVSFYEADAFARWAGARLPLEEEWETAAQEAPIDGVFSEDGDLHPGGVPGASDKTRLRSMFGGVWEWTASPYSAYPGFKPPEGAMSEYNAKFMCNQMVLRGGSCATPRDHIRPTYRNFFPPEGRWQFAGLRLARDA